MTTSLSPDRVAELEASLHPLKVDAETGEPYLRLPKPLEHIVITPQRLTDVAVSVKNLNDLRIARFFVGPPYPYEEEHAVSWLTIGIERTAGLVSTLKPGEYADGQPVNAIRDTRNCSIKDAGMIGDCTIDRCVFGEIMDMDERKRLAEDNAAKKVGDPTIVWQVGDWVDPAYHGQGIMTAVLRAIMENWVVPRMNAHYITALAHSENRGSVRVFEKNGFKCVREVPNCVTITEAKGGGRTGLHVLSWREDRGKWNHVDIPATDTIQDSTTRGLVDKYLGVGETIFDVAQATAVNSSWFKRK
ncbi:hypothetical protein BKA62DRAFT_668248 [Auriculariales sp. MPI-PUGE-AT-0066]|nr:hypothetical protein BKA62DRAFT_668248 [Auriculariales sp. MPI-PUGE-AT-0066]